MSRSRLFAILGISLLAVSVLAGSPDDWKLTGNFGRVRSVDRAAYINANRIFMPVSNRGDIGWGMPVPGVYLTVYPYTDMTTLMDTLANKKILFTAGIQLVGIDSASDSLKSSVAFYSQNNFRPGNMMGGIAAPDGPQYRVYKLYSDSLQSNPNYDYLNWPVDQGAPVDAQGKPLMRGNQMLWSVYNDLKDTSYYLPGMMGIEVQQTTWASRGSGTTASTESYSIFLQYKIYNRGNKTIRDMYFGSFADPDLGDPSDDKVGCDTLDNLFYCYNGNDIDSIYGAAPPALGFKYIYGLLSPSPGDTAMFDGAKIADQKNLGMTAFAGWVNPADCGMPYCFYQRLTGYDAPNGTPWGNGTHYAFPGDPVTGTGDIDSTSGISALWEPAARLHSDPAIVNSYSSKWLSGREETDFHPSPDSGRI